MPKEKVSQRAKPTKVLFLMKILMLGVAFAIIYDKVDWSSSLLKLQQVSIIWLLGCFMLYTIEHFFNGEKLYAFLNSTSRNIRRSEIQWLNFRGTFFDTFIPGRVGSDLYKLFSLDINKPKMLSILLSIRVQNLYTQIAALALSSICLYGYTQNVLVLFTMILAGGGLIMPLVFFLVSKVKALRKVITYVVEKLKLDDLQDCLLKLIQSRHFYTNFIYSIIIQILAFFFYFFLFQACHIEVSYSLCLFLSAFIPLAYSLPITIHGRGIIELLLFSGILLTNNEDVLLFVGMDYLTFLIFSLLCGTLLIHKFLRGKDLGGKPHSLPGM